MGHDNDVRRAFEIYIGEVVPVRGTAKCSICKKVYHDFEYAAAATWEYKVFPDGVERRKFLIEDGVRMPCGHTFDHVWIDNGKEKD